MLRRDDHAALALRRGGRRGEDRRC
jgi:hypothetical protein